MLSVSFLTRYVVEKAVFAISGWPEKDQTRVKYKSVFPGEVRYFVQTCMMQVGAKEEHASSLAELLVSADTRGHYSHGLNRLGDCKTSNGKSKSCNIECANEHMQVYTLC